MRIKIFILLCMIFCHIVDDYYLQGWLASAKQKKWWEQNCSNKLYKNDYIIALFMHSFSWSFMMMIPCNLYIILFGGNFCFIIFVLNIIIHMYIDNLKANKNKINLIQDQILHIFQIFITWFIFFIC